LRSNVKTRQELRNAETKIVLVDHETTTAQPQDSDLHGNAVQIEETASTHKISQDLYADLHDTIAASFIPDRQGELYHSQSSILLRSLRDENTQYIDLVVENLAKDLGAHLISVDPEDLGDIGHEFSFQDSLRAKERKPKSDDSQEANTTDSDSEDSTEQMERYSSTGFAEFYFASPSRQHGSVEALARNKAAVAGILRSPKLKSKNLSLATQYEEQDEEDKSPMLLHIRGTNEIMDASKGYRFFSRFGQFVREFRKTGEEVLMIVSISKTQDPFLTSCPRNKSCYNCTTYTEDRLVRKLLTDGTTTIDIPIFDAEKAIADAEKNAAKRRKDLNIRHLKRALRTGIPRNLSVDLIDPPAVWKFDEASSILKFLESDLLDENAIKRVAKQIVGRTRGKSSLELEDVFVVLGRLNRRIQSRSQPKSDEKTKSDSASDKPEESTEETETEEPPTWSQKLDNIREDCTDTEKELLANVVDPG
jgi:hypothetical protein